MSVAVPPTPGRPLATHGQQVAAGSGRMFDGIAKHYDRANFWLSLGLDARWRKRCVRALGLGNGEGKGEARILDLATGTADVALTAARALPAAAVVGIDPAAAMLEIGRQKIATQALNERVTLELGDAQALRFEAASFDGATMAFGIRNVPDREQALREIARVLKPGARLALLEFAEPQGSVLSALTRWYMRRVVPRLGAWLVRAPEYAYLQASIAAFPQPADFAEQIQKAGFATVSFKALHWGACWLFVAERDAA